LCRQLHDLLIKYRPFIVALAVKSTQELKTEVDDLRNLIPARTLDVSNYVRPEKNSSQPVRRSVVNDSAIVLTHLYTLCSCNGGSTGWVRAQYGTTACSW